MNQWKVRFKKLMDKQWNLCEKPFKSKDSAKFFATTVMVMSPYALEAEAYEEEINGKS